MWCLWGQERYIQDFSVENWRKENTYRCRWKNNFEKNIKEIVREGTNWFYVAQLTERLWVVVHKLMDLRGPLKEWNILASCGSVGFWRKTQVYEVSYLVIFIYYCCNILECFQSVCIYTRNLYNTQHNHQNDISIYQRAVGDNLFHNVPVHTHSNSSVYHRRSLHFKTGKRQSAPALLPLRIRSLLSTRLIYFSLFLNFIIHSLLVLGILHITTLGIREVFY
jgi:hypothetical protein